MINLFITNLGKYNEGELKGQWLTLPATTEELQSTLNNIGINEQYEEYFITDSETNLDIEIGEYSNIENLNTIASALAELDEFEMEQVKALLEAGHIEINIDTDFRNELDNNCFIEIEDMYNKDEALGYALAEINDIENKLGELAYYFDYEKYGRDARLNGVFISSNNIAILN